MIGVISEEALAKSFLFNYSKKEPAREKSHSPQPPMDRDTWAILSFDQETC